MSEPVRRKEPSDESQKGIELKQVGNLPPHEFTNETSTADQHIKHVPKNDFRGDPNAKFEHKAKQGFEIGDIWIAIRSILAMLFPSLFKAESYKAPQEFVSADDAAKLSQFQKAQIPEDSPEVVKVLNRIFPPTEGLSKEWKGLTQKSSQEKEAFLRKVEEAQKKTDTTGIGVPYTQNTRELRLHELRELKEMVTNDLVDSQTKEWRNEFQTIKDSPLDQDPTHFFTYFTKVQEKIEASAQKTDSDALNSANARLKTELQTLEKETTTLLTDRVKEQKAAIENKLPKETLQEIGESLGIPVDYNATYSELFETVSKAIKNRKEPLQKTIENSRQTIAQTSAEIEKLNKELKEIPGKKGGEEAAMKLALETVKKNAAEALETKQEAINQGIAKLDRELELLKKQQKQFLAIKGGNVLKGEEFSDKPTSVADRFTGLFKEKAEWTKQYEEQLTGLNSVIAEVERTQAQAKKQLDENKLVSQREENAKLLDIKDDYTGRITGFEHRQENISKEIDQLRQNNNAADNALTKATRDLNRFTTAETAFAKAVDAQIPSLKGDLEKWIRLAFYEETFAVFKQSADRTRPLDLITNRAKASPEQAAFKGKIQTELKKLGISESSSETLIKGPISQLGTLQMAKPSRP